ncbi:MAG: bifunctional molybdenum cofactor biosynthesis protein MoaC/MoaB [Spirochaetia bacterium]|nr:bifunctional molybdenum cofactor biosynthesis protein MoaC/MoaB [Spirochaetia bacterium]
MIDITRKRVSLRHARAGGFLACDIATARRILANDLPKGNLLDVARAAGLLASKKTQELIPHCHPVSIDKMQIDFQVVTEPAPGVLIEANGSSIGRTGIEMEALTAVSVAALTIYDLLKPIAESLEIQSIKLLEKLGGKSDPRFQAKAGLRASVLVISDSTAAGSRLDKSGQAIKEILAKHGIAVQGPLVVPDEIEEIRKVLKETLSECDFVFTTGGTGLSPRDVTPEAILPILDRTIPAVAEAMHAHGQSRTAWAMLSRSFAGVIGNTVVVSLPGSTSGATESLDAILPGLFHANDMLKARGHN